MKTLMLGVAAALVAMGAAPVVPMQEDHVVQISDKTFQPDLLTIRVGERVIWKNGDRTDHTVTDIGRLKPGQMWGHTFTQEGCFEYRCSIHPKMVGVVVVTP